MTDANEITHALRLWFQAGDVFEVRVLDAVSADAGGVAVNSYYARGDETHRLQGERSLRRR